MKAITALVLGVLIAFGLATVPVQAATPGIVDHAHILQGETVSKVSAAFGELKQAHHKDILIETYPGIPDDLKGSFTPEQKAQFFSEWASKREAAEKVNGIYVLICMDPTYLQVGVGNETQKRIFTLADRDQLKQKLISGLKEKKYDETMRALPGFFATTFQTNLKAARSGGVEKATASNAAPVVPASGTDSSASSGFSFGSILVVFVCIVLGVMIFSFIARMLFGGGGAGAGQPGYAGGGGGGFFSSLLGGIGGAIAGNYIYDSFFRGDNHSSSDAHAGGQDSSGIDNSTDSSFSNDGGGFDSGGDGGGGDF